MNTNQNNRAALDAVYEAAALYLNQGNLDRTTAANIRAGLLLLDKWHPNDTRSNERQ